MVGAKPPRQLRRVRNQRAGLSFVRVENWKERLNRIYMLLGVGSAKPPVDGFTFQFGRILSGPCREIRSPYFLTHCLAETRRN
jgi:hypothetical protein